MTAFRPFLGLALAVLLGLTSAAIAQARGQMAAGSMVICVGGQVMTVAVDRDGQPTGAPHVCPDCVMGAVADAGAAPAPIPAAFDISPAFFCPHRDDGAGRMPPVPAARGPPAV